jgi:hypothetical protein
MPLSNNFYSPKKRKKLLNNYNYKYKYSKIVPIKQNTLTLYNKKKEHFKLSKNFLE